MTEILIGPIETMVKQVIETLGKQVACTMGSQPARKILCEVPSGIFRDRH